MRLVLRVEFWTHFQKKVDAFYSKLISDAATEAASESPENSREIDVKAVWVSTYWMQLTDEIRKIE